MMDGAISGKTGFTADAGYCYVGALRRDERTFIVALLACGWPNHKGYKWSDDISKVIEKNDPKTFQDQVVRTGVRYAYSCAFCQLLLAVLCTRNVC